MRSRCSLPADFFDPLAGFVGRSSVAIVRSAINPSQTTLYFAIERVFLFFRKNQGFPNHTCERPAMGSFQRPKWSCSERVFGGDFVTGRSWSRFWIVPHMTNHPGNQLAVRRVTSEESNAAWEIVEEYYGAASVLA